MQRYTKNGRLQHLPKTKNNNYERKTTIVIAKIRHFFHFECNVCTANGFIVV